ncbi:transcriptional regulator [Lactobacillus nasalidis]|uniref:Transcriptional regulator n=1 Tax=Lactobacillus nasalidis TaxID=2797258 RepID=A0ABQ3W4A6_9LACO|nr:MerR family transcriptional regulator [Lactobacillus nasalidis]GHV97463.1 transcriptional regulator [Lactobacillus nasalidis]GHV99514.1 transcriptional regulator [Lactobacillus nasalidis]GHW00327.1 transcriptional regulator [Lactobacillus nasalidis]
MPALKEKANTLSITEVSKLCQLPVSTLRYYDNQGLIPGLRRTDQGVREFDQRNIDAVRIIECLKNSGMSITDIRTFMTWCVEGDSTLPQRLEMFKKQREAVLQQIALLEQTLWQQLAESTDETIDQKCEYYTLAVKDGTEKKVMAKYHPEY